MQSVANPAKSLESYKKTGGKILAGNTTYREIQPEGVLTPAFNSESKFKIPDHGQELLRHTILRVKVSALTASTGTPRWANALACYLFDRIQVYTSGSNDTHNFDGDKLYNLLRIAYSKEYYDNVIADQIADASDSDRDTLAEGEQTLYLPLGVYINALGGSFQAHRVSSLRVDCSINALDDLAESGSTLSASINDIRLICKYTDAGQEVNSYLNGIYDNNRALAPFNISQGWYMSGVEHIKLTDQIPSGSSTFTMKLGSLMGQRLRAIVFTVHSDSDLSGNSYTAPIALKKYSLLRGQTHIDQTKEGITDDFYRKVILPNSNILGVGNLDEDNIYVIPFSETAFADYAIGKTDYGGGVMDFTGVSDTKLDLEFTSSLGSGHTVKVLALADRHEILREGRIEVKKRR